MKKIINAGVLSVLALVCAIPLMTSAAVVFDKTLSYGTLNNADVVELQLFLREQGFFNEEATGNYLTLTRGAVMAFQASVGIDTTGFFGPLTMAAANAKVTANVAPIVLNTQAPSAQVSALTLTSSKMNQSASVLSAFVQDSKTLTWQSVAYPAGAGVDIHLLRKVSDAPMKYEFVRNIATNTPNDGTHTWTPASGDSKESNLYIEIACSTTYEFTSGCGVGGAPLKY